MIEDGKIYRRYDYKKGRTLPEGAIPCQEEPDPITGHFPHWLLCTENDPNAKYYVEAFERQKQDDLTNGTYELIGKHINGNPYNLDTDILEKHGKRIYQQLQQKLSEDKTTGRTAGEAALSVSDFNGKEVRWHSGSGFSHS